MQEITRDDDRVAELLKSLPDRICDVIAAWSERSPDRPALVEPSGSWSYRQLASVVSDTQRWLLDLDVRPGDRVMIVGENCRAFVAILLTLAGLDAWPVLVSARLSAREVDQIREHCGARRLIYTTSVSVQAREHAKRHGATIQETTPVGPIARRTTQRKCRAGSSRLQRTATRRSVTLYVGHNWTPQGRHADAPEPAFRRLGVSENSVPDPG